MVPRASQATRTSPRGPDGDGDRADAPVGDLEGRAEGPAGAAQAHHHAVVASSRDCGSRRWPRRPCALTASCGIRPRRALVDDAPRRSERAARASERDAPAGSEPASADARARSARWPASARRPRCRLVPAGAARSAPKAPRRRPRRQARARAAPGDRFRPATTTTRAPCRRRRRSHRPGRRTGAAWTGSASATTARSATAAAGSARASQPGERGEAANHGSATDAAGSELRARALASS